MRLDMRNSSVESALKQMALQDISKAGREKIFAGIVFENETVLDTLLGKCNNLWTIINAFRGTSDGVKEHPMAQAAMVESFSLIHMLRQLVTQQEMILNFAFEVDQPGGGKQLRKVEQSYESLIKQDLLTATKEGVFLRDSIKRLADDSLIQEIGNKFYEIQNAESVSTVAESKVWEKIQTLTWFDIEGYNSKPRTSEDIEWVGNKFVKKFNHNLIGKFGENNYFQRYYNGLAFNRGWLWEWFSEMVVHNQQLLNDIFYSSDEMAVSLFFNADEVERDTLPGWKGGDYQGNTERQQYQAKYENQKLMSIESILTVLSELIGILSMIKMKNQRIKEWGVKELQELFLSSNAIGQILDSSSAHVQKILEGLEQKVTNIDFQFL